MKTTEQIYQHFAQNGVYLPEKQLEEVKELIDSSLEKHGYFGAITLAERLVAQIGHLHKDKNKGAFKPINLHDEWTDKSSKAVIQMDPETEEFVDEHPSLYAAAAALGLSRQACGNISLACRNGGTRYKYKWKFADEKEN